MSQKKHSTPSKGRATPKRASSPGATKAQPPPEAMAPTVETPSEIFKRIHACWKHRLNRLPLTEERAVELASIITWPGGDEIKTFALIALLEGIFNATFEDETRGEELTRAAVYRAFTETIHFDMCLAVFSALDDNDPDALRIIQGKFTEEEADEVNTDAADVETSARK